MTHGALDFKIEWEPTTKMTETLWWTHQQSKYEIHVVLLEKVELSYILPHCLRVLHKIGQVGLDIKEQQIASYLQVLPRTMSMTLQSYWKQVIQEYDEFNADPITNLDKFNSVLKTFSAGHSTEDNHHDLLESLRSSSKPDSMKVQKYFYWIEELNNYVEWLPGHEEKLKLNLAFYNGLLGSWQAKYMIARRSVYTDNQSELLRYFCIQEHQQCIIDDKNEVLWAKAQAKLDCGQEILSQHATQCLKAEEKMRLKRAGVKHQHGNPNSPKNKYRVCPEDLCPIHPMTGHNWGEWYTNAGRHKDVKKNHVATNRKKKKDRRQMFLTLPLLPSYQACHQQ
jgi:hypothetical protein